MYENGIPTHELPYELAVRRHSAEAKSPIEVVHAFLGCSVITQPTFLNRGEQPEEAVHSLPGALRGDFPLSIAEQGEV